MECIKKDEYDKLIKRIKMLLKKINNVKSYNLSGVGWQDFYSASEVKRLHQKNEIAENKRAKYTCMIYEMVDTLLSFGVLESKILESFDQSDKVFLLQIIGAINSKKLQGENKSSNFTK